MKSQWPQFLTVLNTFTTAAVLIAGAVEVSAQSTLTAWTLDSGGGRSTGSVHTVTSSLGQLAGGVQTSKSFQMAGGYFGLVAVVPTAGAPALRLERTPREVILAWPATARGFLLEQTPSLTLPAWSMVSGAASLVGQEYQVRLPWQAGDRFFRLRKP